ncbi:MULTISPECIES: hypothetical protein [Xanthomonas]|uniref:Uncharacterized protein n=2 Tax=Xanthomonas TaxID=338 RepID=A0A7Z7J3T9_XANCH|nr:MULTISPECIES: hypothetical protein [Xanthomonas]UZA99818.1 hypothetical protein OM946_00695 [Xanthomonas citri pv. fuscans]UZB03717.1 hypothetical protein OM948_20455 [Xanthomonas citri pv. fuscans]UZB08268.1 hypothetical protein OM953_00695 [Xanthomonas citri pv. fuscans]SON97783.1 hypothetical protein XFF6990_70007 [Xanthomonas citri pv. fuscans]SOO26799.1 hypothetical protein XFF6991_570364 [Xanthomonas phaseoli pv. phaseoli]
MQLHYHGDQAAGRRHYVIYKDGQKVDDGRSDANGFTKAHNADYDQVWTTKVLNKGVPASMHQPNLKTCNTCRCSAYPTNGLTDVAPSPHNQAPTRHFRLELMNRVAGLHGAS